MSHGPGVAARFWFRWKSLQLPWRRQILIGYDLAGNTFWEFKDALNANRLRRIVKNSSKTHFADVRVSPQWHQWLRHTRVDPPSIQEQQLDLVRQAQAKQLAAQADARWASKPSLLDSPSPQRHQAQSTGHDFGQGEVQRAEASAAAQSSPTGDGETFRGPTDASQTDGNGIVNKSAKRARQKAPSPFDRPQGNPGDAWQPASWSPPTVSRR